MFGPNVYVMCGVKFLFIRPFVYITERAPIYGLNGLNRLFLSEQSRKYPAVRTCAIAVPSPKTFLKVLSHIAIAFSIARASTIADGGFTIRDCIASNARRVCAPNEFKTIHVLKLYIS